MNILAFKPNNFGKGLFKRKIKATNSITQYISSMNLTKLGLQGTQHGAAVASQRPD